MKTSTVANTVGLPAAPVWHGVYSAVVYANNDPLSQGRVILLIPQIMGTALSNWAEPLSQVLGPPAPGTYVLAAFAGGDINKPVFWIQQSTATLLTDTWHSLGTLTHYTVNIGRYRLTTSNELQLDINVTGDGSQATTTTFSTTLPAAYRPVTTHNTLPLGTDRTVTGSDNWPRFSVNTSGNVSITDESGATNTFATCVRVPID